MGFYQQTERDYGTQAIKALKTWEKSKTKLAKILNRRCFLLKCRKDGIIPNHITNATKNVDYLLHQNGWRTNNKGSKHIIRLGHKILNLEISSNQKEITKLQCMLIKLKSDIINLTNEQIFLEFTHKQSKKYNRIFHLIKKRNINKFNHLYNSQLSSMLDSKPSWIKNLTNVNVPNDILQFMALGPQFTIEPTLGKDIKLKSILADVDYATSFAEDTNVRKNIIARCTNVITNYHNKSIDSKPDFFRRLLNKTHRFLSDHQEIILTKSDKCNVTVIMYKADYISLSYELINDNTTYIQLNNDPTFSIQNKCNSLIKTLYDDKYIEINTKKKLTSYNGIAPKFYTLPKIHKPTLSVRPIVASMNSPLNLLSSYITDILTRSYNRNNPYYIKDSFEMFNIFNRSYLPENHVLASLDVVSLFSNIHIDHVLNIIEKNWNNISNQCIIPKEKFKHIISFLFNNTYFEFDNKFFKQRLGTPMGAEISPILASYVMDDLLNRIIPTLTFKIFFIKKYVDDIILSLPRVNLNELLETFNNFDKHINFTLEIEDDQNSIPFLDTRIIRTSDNMLLMDWYRKPNTSGRYINYWSYHKHSIKMNLIKQMKCRVSRISDHSFHSKNLSILYKLFRDNSYPKPLLKFLLYNWSPTTDPVINLENTTSNTISNNTTLIPKYVSLPFIDGITQKLCKIFKDIPNIKTANTSVLKINSIFTKLKCKDNVTNMSNVIYSIPCRDCDKIYIGQTSQTIKKRLAIHKSDCKLRPERCALANHAVNNKHSINFNEVKVLDKQPNKTKRLFLEMCHIIQNSNTINKKTDIDHLSEIYSYLLSINNT